MPDLSTALRARLVADSGVAALTATYTPTGGSATKAIFWGNRPQNSPLPGVRLNVISDPRDQHLGGYNSARLTTVQADIFAFTYGAAKQLGEAIVQALALPATVGGIVFGRTKAEGPVDQEGESVPEGYIYRARLDLRVEHRLA